MTQALVLVAHGSRRQASNQEVTNLTEQIARIMQPQYPIVCTGFLELAEPLIPDAIQKCIDQGAEQVKIIPYFLSAGRHVEEDIPAEIAKVQTNNPAVTLTLLPHIGGSKAMISLIQDAVLAAKATEPGDDAIRTTA